MTFAFDPVLVSAFALALVRASAWLFTSPPFNTRLITVPVKAGVAAVLAMAAAPHIADAHLSLETGSFIGALIVQAVIGVVLGFMTTMLVNAIASAGALIDLFSGYSLASVYDPMSDTQNSVFGRFYQLI